MEDNKPKNLYKYRIWNDFTKEILLENKLYFSCANEFNDPFDCSINLKMDGTRKQWSDATIKARTNVLGRNPTRQERKKIRYLFNVAKMSDKNQMGENFTEILRRDMGVYCFSSCRDNILMWSHYANNHRGICLIFNYNDLHAVRKVNYEIDYPSVSYFNDDEEKRVTARYFTKAENWAYENEYRIAIPNLANKKVNFAPQVLKGVIIGCCMSKENVEELDLILKSRGTPIKLYRAEKKKQQFGLDIVLIKTYGSV